MNNNKTKREKGKKTKKLNNNNINNNKTVGITPLNTFAAYLSGSRSTAQEHTGCNEPAGSIQIHATFVQVGSKDRQHLACRTDDRSQCARNKRRVHKAGEPSIDRVTHQRESVREEYMPNMLSVSSSEQVF